MTAQEYVNGLFDLTGHEGSLPGQAGELDLVKWKLYVMQAQKFIISI